MKDTVILILLALFVLVFLAIVTNEPSQEEAGLGLIGKTIEENY